MLRSSLVILAAACLKSIASSEFVVPSGAQGPYSTIVYPPEAISLLSGNSFGSIETPRFKWSKPVGNVTVAVMLAPMGMCDPDNKVASFTRPPGWGNSNPVALMYQYNKESGRGCFNQEIFAVNAQRIGADYAIYRGYYFPVGFIAPQIYDKEHADIPSVFLDTTVHTNILNYLSLNTTGFIGLQLTETINPWDAVHNGGAWTFFQFSQMCVQVYTITVGSYKWYRFVTEVDKGLKPTISQSVLGLSVFSCIFKILFAIDPFGKKNNNRKNFSHTFNTYI